MMTIRINPFEGHPSTMVLSSPTSSFPDQASFRVLKRSEYVLLAVMEDAAGPVESSEYAFKLAKTSESIFNLKNEYNFYIHQLAHLQGSVVPTCYGLFEGSVDGQLIACLAMEYCMSTREERDTGFQRAAKRSFLFLRPIMLAHRR